MRQNESNRGKTRQDIEVSSISFVLAVVSFCSFRSFFHCFTLLLSIPTGEERTGEESSSSMFWNRLDGSEVDGPEIFQKEAQKVSVILGHFSNSSLSYPKITTKIDQTPFPNKTNSGPGHAPVIAQPKPKIVPPIMYLKKVLSLEGKLIFSP